MVSFPLLISVEATRDFAWANLFLLVAGAGLLVLATRRSFRKPEVYRGKILGSIVSAISVLCVGFFAFGIFYEAHVPEPKTVPNVGEKAPEFTLPDQDGKMVALADLLGGDVGGQKAKGAVLIFYRGFW
jgi:hypothetical protein